MTKGELLELFAGLNQCGNLTGHKFGYFVARNINTLKKEAESIGESIKALKDNYAKKVDGKPLVENNQYVFEDKEVFNVEYKSLLEEEIKPGLYKIKLAEVPDTITAQQFNGIFSLINE